ncbi:probable methyltransferase PMT15 [Cucurbita moschata]|uniref:Methyltransferase n=1 Tax=Cucurbita moschata TaxID=3662 RepID=A0A6J1G0W3_CUCMO|nr:probable methyltransferase PMT15 [Cucurbita moschata]
MASKWPSPKPTRKIFTISLIFLLCICAYFLGLRQHPSSAIALLRTTPCTTLPNTTTTTTGGKPNYFPACGMEYSEYTPCEDTKRSLKFTRHRLIYRERHCPEKEEVLKCRIPPPPGYRNPFPWPESRDYAWYLNVPHKSLTVEKAVQNWIIYEGERFRFPGGGTMFPNGADAYIDKIGKLINLKDGSIRTAIDTGCGVGSWGAYLLSRDIVTMSFAPRDTHEAQVQFALERGVPALIGVLSSKRLPYPSSAFDMAHCSRCLIPWPQHDGILLIEVDRVLRPGGYWILSGPPINWKQHWKGWQRTKEDLNSEQLAIEKLAKSLCWTKLVEHGDIAIWQKPINHLNCKTNPKNTNNPPFCKPQDPDKAWYTEMQACLTHLPQVSSSKEIAGGKLARWPERLTAIPQRVSRGTVKGVTEETFIHDSELWRKRLSYYRTINNQLSQPGRYRNFLDMNAFLGGFAAALVDDPVWVMNVVPVDVKVNTLGVIYDRGLIGTYQDWCEAMSTYPRTYDFIHADSVFSLYENRCEREDILLEIDRILRPEGSVIFRENIDILTKIKTITDRLNWSSQIVHSEDGSYHMEKLLFAVKNYWTASPEHSNQQGSKPT